MANAGATFKWRPGAKREVDEAVGYGVVNLMLYAEERAKADTVVRGGHRSFYTGAHLGGPLNVQPSAADARRGKGYVGGNLRRSTHARVSVHGRVLYGGTDQNGVTTPSLGGGRVIEAHLGTNSGYGEWVDQGTSKMPARPAIMPAIQLAFRNAEGLMRAGAARVFGRR